MKQSNQPVIVLDRDGVINQDSPDFIKTPDEWQAIPGSLEAIAKLGKAGFKVVVATNQSGVGRGLLTVETLWAIHRKMLAEIAAAGGYVERIFFCLHTPDDHCDCRKPKPGLLYQAAEYLACGLQNMIVIGDAVRDIEAAQTVNARGILVRTGKGRQAEKGLNNANVEIYDDLASAADALVAEYGS